MIVIVGSIIVLGAVLGGFTMAGGHVGALLHPSELLTIGGSALGALIIMSPKKVLVDLIRGVIQSLKGSPYKKQAYEELFKAMYELLRLARRDGMLALEPHLSNPHESEIFNRYPLVAKNHHITEFVCGSLAPVIDGVVKPQQVPELMNAEIKALEDEHHAPLNVLVKTADAMPGFGIVAAVLGIVVTMGHIDGPVEEIGHKVGAALVGTFLGILLSYGFLAPLAVKMEFLGISELAYFRTAASIVEGFVNDLPPKIAIEQARRGLSREVRPEQHELEEALRALDGG
jgi:chemotaxis protein MotA